LLEAVSNESLRLRVRARCRGRIVRLLLVFESRLASAHLRAHRDQGRSRPDWKVEVGGGETAFAPLDEDAHVGVERGPQGGSHVWVSLEVQGVTLEYVQVEIEVRDANSAVVSRAISSATVQKDVILGQRAYVSNDFHGEALIRVKIANPGGTLWATDERHVIVD